MERYKLTAEIQLNLEITISHLRDLLQSNNFGVTSMIQLKASAQADQNWNQYTLIRILYPKENHLDQYLATPARNVVHYSILVQVLSKSKVKIELTRSHRFLSSQAQESKLLKLADQKLNT